MTTVTQTATVTTTPAFAHIVLAHIAPSLTNPRQHFDPASLAELAASIAASGVHQPILVRPLPGSRMADTDRAVQYELVAGARRLRASEMAGLATIPAIVRKMTDDQALEAQLVENLQRADLTALEEATGYQRLMDHAGITTVEMATKIGKSKSYVYGRLKLLDLCPEARAALQAAALPMTHALHLARINDHKQQIKTLAELERHAKANTGDVLSERALQVWITQNVMLRLDRANFKPTDAGLLPAAGACTLCPKRTGADPDLFADVPGGPDLCTDASCYHAKTDAHSAQIKTHAQARGLRLVDGPEAKAIVYNPHGDALAGYSRLDQRRTDVAGDAPTLRSLLTGQDDLATLGAVLIEHPRTKELIEAVPTAEAEALLVTRGLLKTATAANQKANNLERDVGHLKAQLDQRIRREAHQALWVALVPLIHATPDDAVISMLFDSGLLHIWLQGELAYRRADDVMRAALNMPEGDISDEDALRQIIQRLDNGDAIRAAIVVMISADKDVPYAANPKNPAAVDVPLFDAIADEIGLDTRSIIAGTRAKVRAEVEAEIKQLRALAAPKAQKTDAPAAQAGGVAGKGSEKKPRAKKPAAAAPAMHEEEAKRGIAAAMQGLDEGPPVAIAQADTATPAPAAPVLRVGAIVRVLPTARGPKQAPLVGEHGQVTAKFGDSAWDVKFLDQRWTTPQRKEMVVGFDTSELEVIK